MESDMSCESQCLSPGIYTGYGEHLFGMLDRWCVKVQIRGHWKPGIVF